MLWSEEDCTGTLRLPGAVTRRLGYHCSRTRQACCQKTISVLRALRAIAGCARMCPEARQLELAGQDLGRDMLEADETYT